MSAILTSLPSEELESLRQLAGGAVMKRVPVLHGEKLVRCGYASSRAGMPVITTMGRAKLAFEITRASWLSAPG